MKKLKVDSEVIVYLAMAAVIFVFILFLPQVDEVIKSIFNI